MAAVKFLTLNPITGRRKQNAATDSITLASATFLGNTGIAIDASTNRIVNVATGTAANDAVNLSQLQSVAQGISFRGSVRLATTAALSATAVGSGIGKTLTATANGAFSLDGVAGVLNDKILVKDQAAGVHADHGIYDLTDAGSAGTPWILTRNIEFDEDAEVVDGVMVSVGEGTANADSRWAITTNDPIIVDTTAFEWQFYSQPAALLAGLGLSLTGNQLDVNAGDGVAISGDNVVVDLAGLPGLEFSVGQLKAKTDTLRGIDIDGLGIHATLAASSGLQFSGGSFDTLLQTAGSLQKDGTGLGVKLDGTTLQSAAAGLSALGMPSLFTIGGVAVGAAVTSANLDTLTDGSNADALHSHAGAGTAQTVTNSFTAQVALAKGDPVSVGSVNDNVTKGDADNDNTSNIIGIADAVYGSAATATIISHGPATGVVTGATPNQRVWLNGGGGGLLVGAPPSGASEVLVEIGYTINATDVFVDIKQIGEIAD